MPRAPAAAGGARRPDDRAHGSEPHRGLRQKPYGPTYYAPDETHYRGVRHNRPRARFTAVIRDPVQKDEAARAYDATAWRLRANKAKLNFPEDIPIVEDSQEEEVQVAGNGGDAINLVVDLTAYGNAADAGGAQGESVPSNDVDPTETRRGHDFDLNCSPPPDSN